MKIANKTTSYVFAILLMFACVMFEASAQDWPNLKRYAEKNKELINNPDAMTNVVFIGNSITQGWASKNPSFFNDNNYVGRGISGQTTPQFLTRFREDVIKLKPQIVVINGGINDIAENTGPYNADFTFGNIMSMAELAKANDIKVILTSVLPASHIPWRDTITNVPEKIEVLNNNIKTYAELNGITYVDYFAQMVNNERGMIAEYTTDGVHVTDEGYRVMERLIKEVIDELLNE